MSKPRIHRLIEVYELAKKLIATRGNGHHYYEDAVVYAGLTSEGIVTIKIWANFDMRLETNRRDGLWYTVLEAMEVVLSGGLTDLKWRSVVTDAQLQAAIDHMSSLVLLDAIAIVS